MINLILLVIGLVLLFKGSIKFSSTKETTSIGGRFLGLVLMLPQIGGFLGLWSSDKTEVYAGYILYSLIILTIIIVGVFFTRQISTSQA